MGDITKNPTYMEGKWSAERIIPDIEKTSFKNLEGAIIQKQTLIDQFEEQFGFSREMEVPDGNYAFNLGMLDELKAAKIKEEEE